METAFGRWLKARRETPAAYARRHGMKYHRVRLFAGIGGIASQSDTLNRIKIDTLQTMASESGIPMETLISEAREASENPTAPRKWTRREAAADA